jgi:LuxR family transcriptional regulator of csgAB operon
MPHDIEKQFCNTRDGRLAQNRTPSFQDRDGNTPRFLISSCNRIQTELMQTFLEKQFAVTVHFNEHLSLQKIIDRYAGSPCLYMLDCLHSDLSTIQSNLEIQSSNVPDHILITLFNVTDDFHLTPLVRHHQVRGIFYRNASLALFLKGIRTLMDGHTWLPRRVLSLCIRSARVNTFSLVEADAVSTLSNREIEILQHVAFGESNQEAADAMQISPHTVKTHLYNIYKKINVPNRLQAALWANTHLRSDQRNFSCQR